MAGGTFDVMSGKVRPGDYINFESKKTQSLGSSERGIVVLPLLNASWGPNATFITILNSAPDGQIDKLGKSVYDTNPNSLLVRETLKNAVKVLVYPINNGTAASATIGTLKVAAKYPGTVGNSINVVVSANPTGGFDVFVYLGTDKVGEYSGVRTADELAVITNKYVVFTGEGALTAAAGTTLSGGTDGACTNSDITAFLDACELVKWNTMCFPIDAKVVTESSVAALKAALLTKIKYLRNNVGKYVKAVVADYDADFEGIINVTNSVELDTGEVLTHAQATAWVAGADAAAKNTQSNTYTPYTGAVSIVDNKTNEEAIEAVKNGELFFSTYENDNGVTKIGIEYDINSLVTFTTEKTKDYRKNRVMRVYDTFAESLKVNFPPNKYDNTSTGWGLMEGVGRDLLDQFEKAGAIKNVDQSADFNVDRSKSEGDETYFLIGLEATDSSEKLYFTIGTR